MNIDYYWVAIGLVVGPIDEFTYYALGRLSRRISKRSPIFSGRIANLHQEDVGRPTFASGISLFTIPPPFVNE